ncbi:hypothetical protein HDU97_003568 [Phlyctochytrium planicorne]|nr:hypothetical protein HDU97_003568 [Phlyctochytrium planicorne]
MHLWRRSLSYARIVARPWVSVIPIQRVAWASSTSASITERNPAKARESFEKAIKLWNDGDSEAARSAFSEKYDDALEAWQQSLEMDPNRADAHVNVANVYALMKKQPNEAVEHYRRATALNPTDGEVQFNYGCVLDSMGRLEDAIVQYEDAVKNGITNAEKNLRNAKARLLSKKLQAAEEKQS